MFERRLKIILGVLFISAFVLVARAMHVQVVQRDRWTKLASDSMVVPRLIETTRGRILDRKGRVLAQDDGCIDACVDYRVIKWEPDEDWIRKLAIRRILDIRSDSYKTASSAQKKQMREAEAMRIRDQIKTMWAELAKQAGKSEDEIQRIRSDIEQRVTYRKRVLWYQRFSKAMHAQEPKEKPTWYRSFLLGGSADVPEIDVFEQTIAEEAASHVILRAIKPELYNHLAKNLDRFPGLELRGSNHRVYPANEIGCHVIGNLGRVNKLDLASATDDPNVEEEDRRDYQYNDLIGRTGLEALLEPTLRGTRGKELINPITKQVVKSWPVIPGEDVTCTIDIDLQADVQRLFVEAVVKDPRDLDPKPDVTTNMHGAAVVLDIKSNEVLAMVSNPGFNLSELEMRYNEYATNTIDSPLINRATQSQFEPGSTVKPIVGIGAIHNGVVELLRGIECTGAPVLRGTRWNFNRCWTMSKTTGENAMHHRIPVPHRGTHGNPDGSLIFSEALCRSCNVYFVNCADQLGVEELSGWMNKFGLGRPTGIGIAESRGRVPRDYEGDRELMTLWSSGIGQGYVSASPLQMSNVAATIARKGIWMKPKLVDEGVRSKPYFPARAGTWWFNIPARVDLEIPQNVMNAARQGMIDVTNDESGTGRQLKRSDTHGITVAGKTGTAQATPFVIKRKKPDGTTESIPQQPSTFDVPNPDPRLQWYRGYDPEGNNLKHAWFIGFAPAENPKIAFAVMVEYGGSGGTVAGPIAKGLLDALVEHGYLARK